MSVADYDYELPEALIAQYSRGRTRCEPLDGARRATRRFIAAFAICRHFCGRTISSCSTKRASSPHGSWDDRATRWRTRRATFAPSRRLAALRSAKRHELDRAGRARHAGCARGDRVTFGTLGEAHGASRARRRNARDRLRSRRFVRRVSRARRPHAAAALHSQRFARGAGALSDGLRAPSRERRGADRFAPLYAGTAATRSRDEASRSFVSRSTIGLGTFRPVTARIDRRSRDA